MWVLDRKIFKQIMIRTGIQRIRDNIHFLKSVPLLQNLSKDTLVKIVDAFKPVSYTHLIFLVKLRIYRPLIIIVYFHIFNHRTVKIY